MTRQLIVLHVSPWSERARWVLDHHGLAYETVQHAPFLGERRLRRLVGRRDAPATVPVLVDDAQVITQSWDIATWADAHGRGAPLLPADHQDSIRRWVELADATSAAGRAIVVAALLRSDAALDESVPPPIPSWLRAASRPLTRYGTRWFANKYGLNVDDTTAAEAKVRAGLDALRDAVARKRYLVDDFSYADIAMATVLQGISPVADLFIALGPATRAVWTHPDLARDYADLLGWRDDLYARHRKRRA